jgi:outer membrane protein TolC
VPRASAAPSAAVEQRRARQPITSTIPGGIGDAFSSLFQGRNPRWTLGLNVTWPIGLTQQETQLARANVQVNQIQAQLKKAELQVATDINTAAINLRNSAQSVAVSQKSRELAERRMEAEQSKFDVGMSTNFQVVQAQRDLQDARNAELRAILNYRSRRSNSSVRSEGGWQRDHYPDQLGPGLTIAGAIGPHCT